MHRPPTCLRPSPPVNPPTCPSPRPARLLSSRPARPPAFFPYPTRTDRFLESSPDPASHSCTSSSWPRPRPSAAASLAPLAAATGPATSLRTWPSWRRCGFRREARCAVAFPRDLNASLRLGCCCRWRCCGACVSLQALKGKVPPSDVVVHFLRAHTAEFTFLDPTQRLANIFYQLARYKYTYLTFKGTNRRIEGAHCPCRTSPYRTRERANEPGGTWMADTELNPSHCSSTGDWPR